MLQKFYQFNYFLENDAWNKHLPEKKEEKFELGVNLISKYPQ